VEEGPPPGEVVELSPAVPRVSSADPLRAHEDVRRVVADVQQCCVLVSQGNRLLVEDLVRLAVDAFLILLGQGAGLLRLSSA